ncbi:hypothetical protein DWY69_04900 [Eisenbergiella massiliensis]|uniref:Uncharacterized protein n=1 Tax=Eisenbergiella massiliensis TaxID=1720294 RepID=A0A3E3J2D6_9FIRM|nr:hypothetical protein DWY69_04900 [Eisenbergiella massiliensis]
MRITAPEKNKLRNESIHTGLRILQRRPYEYAGEESIRPTVRQFYKDGCKHVMGERRWNRRKWIR